MTIEISTAYLYDVKRGEAVEAELWDGITEQQLTDWETEWLPELHGAIRRLHQAGVDKSHWPQSRHWDWRRKVGVMQTYLGCPGFCVMCNGMTQGLMSVDLARHRCQIPEQRGQHLVYVDYLENAPWNRKELLFDPTAYRGVGSMLMRAAIELSKAEGFKGRVGLHSLPQAEAWYSNSCGMTDLGVDQSKDGLRYFEMTAAQSKAFIAKGELP